MIRIYTASADNTIVNTFKENMSTRATGSNTGVADILEVYSVYGRQTTSSQELSRVLIKFPVDQIANDRTAGRIPSSGSVDFFLNLYNAVTSKTVPRNMRIVANPLLNPWQEGTGLDLELYRDETRGNEGSNWMSASATASWNSVSGGGDFLSSSADYRYEQLFESGLEDMQLNITPLVERWIKGSGGGGISNYGIGIKLTSSQEAKGFGTTLKASQDQPTQNIPDGATTSFYTKRFFARGTQYYFKRPLIEAKWDSTRRDHRGQFHISSSLASTENINDIYFYNYVRGRLKTIPSSDSLIVAIYSSSAGEPTGSTLRIKNINNNLAYAVSANEIETGVYKARLQVTSSLTTLHDVWSLGSTQVHTGTIKPIPYDTAVHPREPTYFVNITNLQSSYSCEQIARFNVFVREKNWNPTIYTKAIASAPTVTIPTASYRVLRVRDGLEAVAHDTGSGILATGLSYDVSGNYFDFDMRLLQPDYEYAFKVAFYDEELNSWQEQNELFKFRVSKNEY
tara:strand:+ start:12446 stop:13981 length:1536 start_codon:yes stop_codon:yes gene_type:complete